VRRSTLCLDHQDRNCTEWIDNSPTSADSFSSSGVASRVQAQHGDGVRGDLVPVRVELTCVRIEEDEPCLIALRGGQFTKLGDQRARQSVVREHVEAPAEYEGR